MGRTSVGLLVVTIFLFPIRASAQTETFVGTWYLWSIEGVSPKSAPASSSTSTVIVADSVPLPVRRDNWLLDQTLEIYADGTFRDTRVRRTRQSADAKVLRRLLDAPIPTTAASFVPVEESVDTTITIGEWAVEGDSVVLRHSTAGLGERIAENVAGGDPAIARMIDSLSENALGGSEVVRAAGVIVQGRLRLDDRLLDQRVELTRRRRW